MQGILRPLAQRSFRTVSPQSRLQRGRQGAFRGGACLLSGPRPRPGPKEAGFPRVGAKGRNQHPVLPWLGASLVRGGSGGVLAAAGGPGVQGRAESRAGAMDATITDLVRHAEEKAQGLAEGKQYWITLAGPPGGGKTTISAQIVKKLLERGVQACVIPMDGFHYYRHELDAMPDPEEARNRRGSHWTFNARKLVDVLKKVKKDGCGMLPSFDHAVADPIEDDIPLRKTDKIVLVEGNYLLLYDEEPWGELRGLFDERWFVACDIELLRERVISRNSAAWGWDKAKTAQRVDYNDVPNAKLVASTVKHADRVIQSVQEPWDVDPTPKSPNSRSAARSTSSMPALHTEIESLSEPTMS